MTFRSSVRRPPGGYRFPNKRQYRRDVWGCFRSSLGRDLKRADILLMPSLEGDEIDVALNKGALAQNLHVVDRNPAVVAHLKRRYPQINTYGVELAKACERIAAKGVELRAANIDLCSCLSEEVVEMMITIGDTPCWSTEAFVAVTVLRGRERPSFWTSQLLLRYGIDPEVDDRSEAIIDRPDLLAELRDEYAHTQCRGYPLTDFDLLRLEAIQSAIFGEAWQGYGCNPAGPYDPEEDAAELLGLVMPWSSHIVRPLRLGSYRSNVSTMLWALWCVRAGVAEPWPDEMDPVFLKTWGRRGVNH